MLIISKFHDYYDTVTQGLIDKSIIYKRETKVIEKINLSEKKSFFWENQDFYSHYSTPYIDTYWIMFCNEIFHCIKYQDKDSCNFYYQEDAKHILRIHANSSINNLDNRKTYIKSLDLNIKYKSPIILWSTEKSELIINPCLKDIKFFKEVDSFQTFQKIQMYISGVLGNTEVYTIKTSDKDRLISKGFDLKWSFRKDTPPTRKIKNK